jgi:nucleotide-binding universal stress UspA family protein
VSFLVAYSDTPAGRDALSVGVRYADATGESLDIVVVRLFERSTPPLDGYTRHVEAVTRGWLDKAADRARRVLRPEQVRIHQWMADSVSEGLFDAAATLGSSLVVVGGANDGVRGRLAVSSLARVMLHSSPVPLALAPRRIRKLKLSGISRVTVALGSHEPETVVAFAAGLAERAGRPARAVTLVDPGQDASFKPAAVGTTVAWTSESAPGETVSEALAQVSWEPSEVLVLGSSRLATAGRIFLGSTAGKILREVPVPVIMVPLRSDDQGDDPDGGQ